MASTSKSSEKIVKTIKRSPSDTVEECPAHKKQKIAAPDSPPPQLQLSDEVPGVEEASSVEVSTQVDAITKMDGEDYIFLGVDKCFLGVLRSVLDKQPLTFTEIAKKHVSVRKVVLHLFGSIILSLEAHPLKSLKIQNIHFLKGILVTLKNTELQLEWLDHCLDNIFSWISYNNLKPKLNVVHRRIAEGGGEEDWMEKRRILAEMDGLGCAATVAPFDPERNMFQGLLGDGVIM